jgi:hypothetical protein
MLGKLLNLGVENTFHCDWCGVRLPDDTNGEKCSECYDAYFHGLEYSDFDPFPFTDEQLELDFGDI